MVERLLDTQEVRRFETCCDHMSTKRVHEMTPEQRQAKRARDREYDAWRAVYRLYMRLLDQRGVPG